MKKFIYVFSAADKEVLEAAGFELLYRDKEKNLYIFSNSDKLSFSTQPDEIYYSDIMCF